MGFLFLQNCVRSMYMVNLNICILKKNTRKRVVIAEERFYRLCFPRNKSVRLAYSSRFHGAGANVEKEVHKLEQGHLAGMGLNR